MLLYLLQSAQPGSTLTPDRCSQHEVQSTERGNASEQERGRRMEIFSGVHNKSLIMNNTNGSLFSQWSLLWFAWPLGNCFWLPYGGSCLSKINAWILTCHSRDNYRIKNNAIMYVYLQYWKGILLKQTVRLSQRLKTWFQHWVLSFGAV